VLFSSYMCLLVSQPDNGTFLAGQIDLYLRSFCNLILFPPLLS
jgi:hypothetical protein